MCKAQLKRSEVLYMWIVDKMKLPVIEPQAAVFILCINFVRIIPAHPYPKSDGFALPQCGSETCDTHKRPIPEFCNRVELRCESCSVRTCEEVICVEWNGCANTTPPIPIGRYNTLNLYTAVALIILIPMHSSLVISQSKSRCCWSSGCTTLTAKISRQCCRSCIIAIRWT